MGQTRLTLEEYVQTRDLKDLDKIEEKYGEWVSQFDKIVSAILDGSTVDGKKIIATGNKAVRDAVKELDGNHLDFQKKAATLMAAHRLVIEKAGKSAEAMNNLERIGEEAASLLTKVEELAGEQMSGAIKSGAASKKSAVAMLLGVASLSILLGV